MNSRLSLAVVVTVTLSASPLHAQGHGNGGTKNPHTGPPSSQQAPAGAGVRAFGVWLDDASVMPPGSGWVSVSVSHWRTSLFRQTDVPTIDGGYGLLPRVQIGGSLPYYRASEIGGALIGRGLGDVYLNAKLQLQPVTDTRKVGFALIPVVEILGEAGPEGRRVYWALPGSIEVQGGRFRAYGSADPTSATLALNVGMSFVFQRSEPLK